MMDYWQQLNERERWLVILAGVCCFLYICYAWIYVPLTEAEENKLRQLKEKQATLRWLQSVAHERPIIRRTKTVSEQQLIATMAQELQGSVWHGFPYQLQQVASGDIQLSFAAVPYNQLILWLWDLNKHYNFTVQQLNVEKSTPPGIVKSLVVLSANEK